MIVNSDQDISVIRDRNHAAIFCRNGMAVLHTLVEDVRWPRANSADIFINSLRKSALDGSGLFCHPIFERPHAVRSWPTCIEGKAVGAAGSHA